MEKFEEAPRVEHGRSNFLLRLGGAAVLAAGIGSAAFVENVGATMTIHEPGAPAVMTYGEFSMMHQFSSGQFFLDGQVAGQWQWVPQGPKKSSIEWGEPNQWPPDYSENFRLSPDGKWYMLMGYSNHPAGQPDTLLAGTNEQRVFFEYVGKAIDVEGDSFYQECRDLQPMDVYKDAHERYVKKDIPNQAYCLDDWGEIKTPYGDVLFHHQQIWSPPGACPKNPYVVGKKCITQHEWWQDSTGKEIDRTIYLASGLGMSFFTAQALPSPALISGGNYATSVSVADKVNN